MRILLSVVVLVVGLFSLAAVKRVERWANAAGNTVKPARVDTARRDALAADPKNILTARLVLRPVTRGDVRPLMTIFSNKHVAAALGEKPVKDFKTMYARIDHDYADNPRVWALEIVSSGNVTGLIDATGGRVTLAVARVAWDHGFGSEALAAVTARLAPQKLEADIALHNARARRAAEKAGMRCVSEDGETARYTT